MAIVGGGLAGLAAAYGLRDHCRVVVFEREGRLGGRVLTSDRPRGEQGAEFVLRSEKRLIGLLKELGVGQRRITEYCSYRLGGVQASGGISSVARALLSPESARHFMDVGMGIQKESPPSDRSFAEWLFRRADGDLPAIRLIEMILAGETCAPLHHIDARYGAECLFDTFIPDQWYRIRGGADQLVTKLSGALARSSSATVKCGFVVARVSAAGGQVEISGSQKLPSAMARFDAAVLTAPDADILLPRNNGPRLRLLGRPRHYHAYISLLLEFREAWWRGSGIGLENGLSTDGLVNFVEEVRQEGLGTPVLRMLLPTAESLIDLSDRRIVQRCVEALRQLTPQARAPLRTRVQKWAKGLPCGGARTMRCLRVGTRTYLAGDRFARWPSMNGAVESGFAAARAVLSDLRAAGRSRRPPGH